MEIDLEFDSNPNHECIFLDSESNGCINKNKTHYKEIIKNFNDRKITFRRDFRTKEDFKEWKNKRFTGLKLSWKCKNCDGKNFTDDGYKFFDTKLNHENKLFNKIANIVQNSQDKFDFNPEDTWKALKIAKTTGYFDLADIYPKTVIGKYIKYETVYEYIYDTLFMTIRLNNISESDLTHLMSTNNPNITTTNLEAAAQMFIYLTAPPHKYWMQSFSMYLDWLEKLTLKRLLGIGLIYI